MSNRSLKNIQALRNGPAILGRIRWIDAQLNWVGEFNRNELVETFGVSKQQASSDINLYSELAPENFSFDHSLKAFAASTAFTPLFEHDPLLWLQENQRNGEQLRGMGLEDIRGIPQYVEPGIFRVINRCRKRKMPVAVEIGSLSSDLMHQDIICPHSIVATPVRWHVRAWSKRKQTFLDIPISRIFSAVEDRKSNWIPSDADVAWQNKVSVILAPADYLGAEQRKIIATAYGMHNGELAIETRECLVYYLLSSMQLLSAVREYGGEAINPNLRIRVVNYQSLLPLVTSAETSPDIPHINFDKDASIWYDTKNSAEMISDEAICHKSIIWLGSGLAKIAASYGNELCVSKGISSKFASPLDYAFMPSHIVDIPILVTLAGKGEDAVDTARNMVARANRTGIVTCDRKGDAFRVLGNTLHYGITGFFPERDKRFINLRSVISLSALAERVVEEGAATLDSEAFDLVKLSKEAARLGRKVAMKLSAQPHWKEKQWVILGRGLDNCYRHTWCSLLAEAGVATPVWTDIKDYTHGDHRAASLHKNQIFLLVGEPCTDEFCDIFEERFSTCFPVDRIRLDGDVRTRFWFNLFCALSVTHYLSHKRGYGGKRPPKDPVIHNWRHWGHMY